MATIAAPQTVLRPAFLLLLGGDFVSKVGDYVYRIALPLFVLDITGAPAAAGLTFAAQQAGAIAAGPLTGAFVDRGDPKRIMQISVVGMFALTASLPFAATIRGGGFTVILIVGFLLEALNFAYRASLNSLIPLIVSTDALPTSASWVSFSRFGSKTLGPVVAGALIALVGSSTSLLADAVSFLGLLAFTLFIRLESREAASPPRGPGRSLRADIKSGFGLVFRDRSIRALALLNMAANIGYVPLLSMFVVHLTHTVGLHSQTVGFIYAVDGVGALAVGFLIPTIMKRFPSGLVILGSSALLGLSMLALAVTDVVPVIAVAFLGALGSAQAANRVIFTHWQLTVPRTQLGRVFSVSSTLENLTTPVAAVGAGLFIQYESSYTLLLISALIVILATAASAAGGGVRSIDSRISEKTPDLKGKEVN